MRADLPLPQGEAPLLRNILANIPLYRDLSYTQLDAVVNASLPLRSHGSTLLVDRDAPPTGIHVVVHGQVRLYFDRKDGTEKTLAILEHGKCFGVAETLLNRPQQAAARTISDGMVIYTPRAMVLETARENPAFAERLLVCAAHQAYRLVEDIRRQTMHSAPQRLAGFLLRQSAHHAGKCIELNISKTMIASKLGIANETFSRLLHGFSEEGLVEVRGRQIRILDPKKLGKMQAA